MNPRWGGCKGCSFTSWGGSLPLPCLQGWLSPALRGGGQPLCFLALASLPMGLDLAAMREVREGDVGRDFSEGAWHAGRGRPFPAKKPQTRHEDPLMPALPPGSRPKCSCCAMWHHSPGRALPPSCSWESRAWSQADGRPEQVPPPPRLGMHPPGVGRVLFPVQGGWGTEQVFPGSRASHVQSPGAYFPPTHLLYH